MLGINERNRRYIGRYNPRSLFPLVDNKRLTRTTLSSADIPMAALIGVVDQQSQVKKIASLVEGHQGFAIKPSKGSGGKGILIVTHKDGDEWVKALRLISVMAQNAPLSATLRSAPARRATSMRRPWSSSAR